MFAYHISYLLYGPKLCVHALPAHILLRNGSPVFYITLYAHTYILYILLYTSVSVVHNGLNEVMFSCIVLKCMHMLTVCCVEKFHV
jgi:hypothetical protein